MLRNQLRSVVQSFVFSAVLTKQFPSIKSEFFSTSIFTSVSNLEAWDRVIGTRLEGRGSRIGAQVIGMRVEARGSRLAARGSRLRL